MKAKTKTTPITTNPITIEKGIEIPDRIYGGKGSRYPLSEMKKGDSFFIACESSEIIRKTAKKLNSAAHAFQTKHGGKYAVRAVPDGVRVWKVK